MRELSPTCCSTTGGPHVGLDQDYTVTLRTAPGDDDLGYIGAHGHLGLGLGLADRRDEVRSGGQQFTVLAASKLADLIRGRPGGAMHRSFRPPLPDRFRHERQDRGEQAQQQIKRLIGPARADSVPAASSCSP